MERGQTAIKCAHPYRVKGELGFYDFEVYESLADGWRFFEKQKGKNCYKTENYRTSILYQGATQASYRKVSGGYNRRVRQSEKSLLSRSIQKEVGQEAVAIEKAIESQSCAILAAHGADKQGYIAHREAYDWQHQKKESLAWTYHEMYEAAAEKIKPHLELVASAYEQSDSTIEISIDDICVKEQKTKRPKKNLSAKSRSSPAFEAQRSEGKKKYKKRKFAYSTVVHFQSKEGQYSLSGQGLSSLVGIIAAFLLHNQGLEKNWLFHVDGQRSLQDCLINRFSWHNSKLLLDWYHLQKKIHSQLFKALYKSNERDKILNTLELYAWYGLVQEATKFIDRIKPENIKKQEELDILKGYFERNQDIIPNYEMRHRLGLRNSSNRGEKQNDLLFAQRQKHNGMAWSKDGSWHLAQLTSIKRNGEKEFWFKNQELQFRFAKSA